MLINKLFAHENPVLSVRTILWRAWRNILAAAILQQDFPTLLSAKKQISWKLDFHVWRVHDELWS